MSATKIHVSIDSSLLQRLDQVVKSRSFASRSEIVQEAVSEKINRLDTASLARECAKLDPMAEQALADEGLQSDLASWPKY
jgi:metal-responsive CopG/Arc/MetJ family transcriptional regulator